MSGKSLHAPQLASKHVYLAGYRGSGKSTLGRLLAARLGRAWLDSDDWIESHARRSIREIFSEQGEEAFRDLEQQAIETISGRSPAVVSLGGGAVLREANRRRITASGVCVWLCVDAETVLRRLAADASTAARRPALTDLPPQQEIEKLLAQRLPLYEQVADLRVDTRGESHDAILEQVLTQLTGATSGQTPTQS